MKAYEFALIAVAVSVCIVSAIHILQFLTVI